ncbi:hypothetical protein [Clostridium tagluense]|uniref:Uncharacterized protein n=1 Tax=Clostridium tagluense TaxID=360422 RepID=A0A401UN55_9CLOT|nr:hypothetical protein [Clostridium tagluense]GCD10973.1 hypothetical protein Ctaglu_25960 [Clostridium tagluense]
MSEKHLKESRLSHCKLLSGFLILIIVLVKKIRLNSRKLLSAFLVLIVVPATILFGVFFLNDRKYHFISLLIIMYTIIVFFMSFENRKPQTREIIIIAVLSAIAVAGRTAFFSVPGMAIN